MTPGSNHIDHLLRKFEARAASQEELNELLSLVNDGQQDEAIVTFITQQLEMFEPGNDEEIQFWQNRFKGFSGKVSGGNSNATVHGVHLLKTTWFRRPASRIAMRWASAAAIIILFGIGTYFYTTTQNKNQGITSVKPAPVEKDIMPGKNRAVLTLSSGKMVELDSAVPGTIKDQALSIENKNGRLIYKNGDLVAMNTMTTPKGGQYQLTLADGTRVWLNAASSITYPTAFTKNSREVSITGEVYFEVAKNKTRPFIVKANDKEIKVLGTDFNVNAYTDELFPKISLAEGSVQVEGKILQPGQAYIDGKIVTTNIYQDIAWKNGRFNFQDKELKEIMRQLARWYDLKVIYEPGLNKIEFGGEIPMNLTLTQVLKVLQNIEVHFKLEEGNTLRVMP